MVSLTQPTIKNTATSQAADTPSFYQWQTQLNTSLDIRQVLNAFFNGITSQVPCASLCYRNTPKDIEMELGGKKLHTAKYSLKTSQYSLGEVVFSRSERYSKKDLETLEEGLSLLFYPLRNALLYKEALESSLRDGLTSLSNRAAFELAIKRELSMAQRHNQPLSLIVVDVDFFKKVNDSAGHHAGDQLLAHVACTLKSTLRDTDQVFRIGGEEFAIVLANANLTAAKRVAERARSAIAGTNIKVGDRVIGATVSMGIGAYCSEDTRDSLFERADQALYLAKHSGRNCIRTEWDTVNDTQGEALESN